MPKYYVDTDRGLSISDRRTEGDQTVLTFRKRGDTPLADKICEFLNKSVDKSETGVE